MNSPIYRADIAGEVHLHIDDCEFQMRNEIQSGELFILCAEDTSAWEEFSEYLTVKEMRAAFKRAMGNK